MARKGTRRNECMRMAIFCFCLTVRIHGFGFMVERASKPIKYITYELTLFLFAILAASSLDFA